MTNTFEQYGLESLAAIEAMVAADQDVLDGALDVLARAYAILDSPDFARPLPNGNETGSLGLSQLDRRCRLLGLLGHHDPA